MKLLIGTKNPGKLKEMSRFLGDGFELLPLPPDAPDVAETAATFRENALLKAHAYFAHYHMPVVVEDGGLQIDVLGGEPGVYSRRWPAQGESEPYREKSDDELVDIALGKLADIPDDRRIAHLYAIGIYFDGTHTLEADAAIDGVIVHERTPITHPGLPFRAIFFVPRFGKLYQDLTPEEHDAVNQRRVVYGALAQKIREASV